MRDYIFRGKPKNKDDYYFFSQNWKGSCKDGFVYGCLVVQTLQDYSRYYICVSALYSIKSSVNNGMTSMIEVIPETVGQFIGLVDKNNTKIFEGDIIVIDNHYENPLIIKFIEFSWNCVTPKYRYFRHRIEDNNTKYEVIGNIHDNQKLFKGA